MPNALTITLGVADITNSVDMASVVMNLSGSADVATCEFDIADPTNAVSATDEMSLTVTEVSSAEVLFGGFVRSRRISVAATGRIIHISAVDFNSMLDRAIVIADRRSAGESDADRLEYLMTTYGSQFSSDYSQIATLNGSMVKQKFTAITLRQAIERVLGQASHLSAYHVDTTGRLVTYDRSSVAPAPFDLRVGTPGAGEIAPSGSFEVDNDATNLCNAVYIVGATAAGSGWFTDTTSIATYGLRERFFNAPDADTHAKAAQVGLAVLEDQKDPVPRGSFSTESPNDGWRIGQSIVVTSVQHGLAGVTYRIAKVTVRYLNPAGEREYNIELGAPLPKLSTLLAASQGGGGGYPWHSPGGSGVWPPITQIGDIIFGCQCGVDPISFESFDRASHTGGWGEATPSGYDWDAASGTSIGMLVADNRGELWVGTGYPNTLEEAESPVLAYVTEADRTLRAQFRLSNLTLGGSTQATVLLYIEDLTSGVYLEMEARASASGGYPVGLNLTLFDLDAVTTHVPIALSDGVEYILVFQMNNASGSFGIKCYPITEPEPTTWLIQTSTSTWAATAPQLRINTIWRSTGTGSVSFAWIDWEF